MKSKYENPRYLTKSLFKLSTECPTKLYYADRRKDYNDKKLEDDFLQALARGGYQVGALAKCYYPESINVDETDPIKAIDITLELMEQKDITITEGAFLFDGHYVRVDILVKRGRNVQLLEVKAKTIGEHTELRSRSGISTPWKPYIYDVAYQKHVIGNAYPHLTIKAYLMLADKFSMATIDGLNQKFLIKAENGKFKVNPPIDVDLGEQILTKVPVDDLLDDIYKGRELIFGQKFEDFISYVAENYKADIKMPGIIGAKCHGCEFKTKPEQELVGLKNGFKECWKEHANFNEADFKKPSILEVWDFRKKDEYIREGKFFQEDLNWDDLIPKNKKVEPKDESGLSRPERQFLQIEKSRTGDSKPYFDTESLKDEMKQWKYPLHFIDFETTAVAIPFNKGMKPYEQIAFQFSHHIVRETKEGRIVEHAGQWINTEPGKFPNFDFVRALKAELENDEGTIFRYSHHENSILNAIYIQIQDSEEKDKNELCAFIKTITKSSSSNKTELWLGDRNMVDLCEMVKRFYYHPSTHGSNSIKYVLPSILESSKFLKKEYSKPIYGKTIKSLNYKNQTWLTKDANGKIESPYKKLPKIFGERIDMDILEETITGNDELSDGGAAMVSYSMMQFTEMGQTERDALRDGLLRYCELDTLAMVMIWQAWYYECFGDRKMYIKS
jgi:hypothetical protein